MQDLNHVGQMTTSPEGTDMDSLATMHGLSQLILDTTHLLPNFLSCIDLIFTDQPNLTVDYPYILIVIIKLFIINSV